MRHEWCGILVAVVGLSGLGLSRAEASAVIVPDRTTIVVRTYTHDRSSADMPHARRTAGVILKRADIEVLWIECAGPGDPAGATAHACTRPLAWNELVMRIATGGASGATGSLGFAFVDVHAGGGSLATVYADRVQVMARSAGVSAAELLGRAIAHEVGHLLLGTTEHASHGLMRAAWSGADLRRNRATEWLFGGKEGDVMRQRLAGRSPGWMPAD